MDKSYTTEVCIVGAGPAGMMTALLLAQKGIKVIVVESHKNFEREYRGEVLMPRFTQMLKQLNLFLTLEKYPHLKLRHFELHYKDHLLASLDFTKVSQEAPFAIWMPQPVLLNALYDQVVNYPNFQLLFGVTIREVIREAGKIVGVKAASHGEELEIRAKVTLGSDGRSSVIRKSGGFEMEFEDYDFDLLWFTVKRPEGYENTVRASFSPKRTYIVLPKYPDSVQCGMLMARGEFLKFREKGIGSLQEELLSGHPVMHDFARGLKDFNHFSVLQARISYVKEWAQDGCLLIGDSAHTCSPAGAIGVSVAVGTAIVAADVLIGAFQKKDFSAGTLQQVQRIREAEVKRIQTMQRGFIRAALLNHPSLRRLSMLNVFLLAKLGVMQQFLRRLAVADKPLPLKYL